MVKWQQRLVTFKIEGLKFDFQKDTYIYYLDIGSDIDILDIKPEYDKDTVIKITGNKNLKEGLNNIYINVKGKNKSANTYKLVINKLNQEEEKRIEKNNILLKILLGIFTISVIVMFSLIIIFIKRNYKNRYLKDFKEIGK